MRAHIVVVEDDPYMRELLTIQVQDLGNTVTAFEDGQSAISTLETMKTAPDLIFLDIVLPQVRGISILKKVRENTLLKNTPVVVITGHKDDKTLKECLKLGIKDFLLKPVPEKLLRSRLALFGIRLETPDARAIVSKCFLQAPQVFTAGPFMRYRNKGQTPFEVEYLGRHFIVLIDQAFSPMQLSKLDEDMLMQNARIFLEDAPWLPVYPSRHYERREAKPLDENELKKSLGDDLFEIVASAANRNIA